MTTNDQLAAEASRPGSLTASSSQSVQPEVLLIQDKSISEYFRVLAKYRRLIATIFCVFAFGAAAICALSPSNYTSTAIVAIEPYRAPIPDTAQQGMLTEYSNTEYYAKNRMNMLASHRLADRVLSLPELGDEIRKAIGKRSDDSAREQSKILGYKNDLPLIERYLEKVENLRLPTTTSTKIWAVMPDALLAAKVVNAHSEQFIQMIKEEEQVDSDARVVYLEARSKEIETRIGAAEKVVNQFLREHPMTLGVGSMAGATGGGVASDPRAFRLSEMVASAIDKTATTNQQTKLDLEALRQVIKNSRQLEDMRETLAEKEGKIAGLVAQFMPEHPKVRAAEAEVALLRRSIETEEKSLAARSKRESESNLLIDSGRLSELEAALGVTQQKTVELAVDGFELGRLQREVTRLRDLSDLLSKHLEVAKLTAQARLTNITIISPGIPAKEPTSPNRPVILAIACFLGPLLGCILAFVLNMLDGAIYTVEDMVAALEVRSVGMIPSLGNLDGEEGYAAVAEILPTPAVRDNASVEQSRGTAPTPPPRTGTMASADLEDEPGDTARRTRESTSRREGATSSFERSETKTSGTAQFKMTHRFTGLFRPLRTTTYRQRSATELMTVVEPFSDFTEAFRNIRTSVVLEAAGREAKTLLVTSSLKGEGKSTISANLAVSLAQYGNKVLLVDGDLRRPTLHQFFGMARQHQGLSNYLRGEKGSYEIAFQTSVVGLDFVPAGGSVPNPAELLGTKLMKQFLELMVENYDYIILDAPPVLPVADARILALVSDAVLFTVRSGFTERQVARNGVTRLRQLGINVAGAILNDVDISDALFYHEIGGDDYEAEDQGMPWFAQVRNTVSAEDPR